MRCSFCSFEFDEEEAKKIHCPACLKVSGCEMIKCPKCGYEMLPDPNWVKKIKNFFDQRKRK